MRRNMKTVMMMAAMAAGMWMTTSCSSSRNLTVNDIQGEWNVAQVKGNAVTVTGEEKPFIGFDANEKRVYGYTGCNRLMATFDVKKGELCLSKVGSTMMACPDLSTERRILDALGEVKAFQKLDNGNMLLVDGDKNTVMELTPKQ